jgi:hypothetical protein
VLDRDSHPWADTRIQIDTAGRAIEEMLEKLFQSVSSP